jgi:flagellin-specific chaperone FliS
VNNGKNAHKRVKYTEEDFCMDKNQEIKKAKDLFTEFHATMSAHEEAIRSALRALGYTRINVQLTQGTDDALPPENPREVARVFITAYCD